MLQSGAHHWRCLFAQCMNISKLIYMGNLYLQQIVNIEKFVEHNISSIGITITTYYVLVPRYKPTAGHNSQRNRLDRLNFLSCMHGTLTWML